jgi:hypothetical protein
MGEHKAAIQLVGLRHAKKGSTISEALETIGPKFEARSSDHLCRLAPCAADGFPEG